MDSLSSSPNPIRGRGVSENPANRFEARSYEAEADEPPEAKRPATQFIPDESKSILSRNDSPDVRFNVSVNPYRGCEHGCAYCYARPTHEYLGFSAGLDFETRVMVKESAPALLREALASPKWTPQPIGMSGVTDPYQPVERKLELTRRCLEVLRDFRNPVIVITKNRLVARDADLLGELASHNAASVYVSITTLDLGLNRILEPRTSSPAQRLETLRELTGAGVPVGVLVAPVIPGLTDHEIAPIVEAAAKAGARFGGTIALRLPLAVAPLFEQWLSQHFPDRKDKVLNRIRSMRGGKLYDSSFGARMSGKGPFAEQIQSMFSVACRKAGFAEDGPRHSTAAFRRPPEPLQQMPLFD